MKCDHIIIRKEDFGIVTATDKSNEIDKNKVRRERIKNRTDLQVRQVETVVRGIYFDGREDKTLAN